MDIIEEAIGEEHAMFGQSLHFQAMYWIEFAGRRVHGISQLERAIDTLTDTVGEQANETKRAIADLERVRRER